ncbi:juvenile hormone esterase-like [Planococcus citri]|uniref:juvenile hormone esterase-like n=1 Tax=Planococcus citri TaxID=170843 RepID=UPI0031F8AE40
MTEINPKYDNLKAVIVNIHPGGFFHGSPDPHYYGSPGYIINRNIVYVSVGYRLHLLGHLNLNLKNHCTGNQSLKDIILSLEWIRDNIRVFGGDPGNITLLGSSSGSAIVHCLLLSPLAKGLYHKAILMGMYIFNPTLITCNEHITLAYKIAREQGYEGKIEDRRKLLNFLKQFRLDLYLLSKLHQMRDYYTGLPVFPTSPFVPLGESSDNSPLPLSPDKLIASTNRVPIMVGFCEREGAMGVALLEKLKQSLSQLFHKCLSQNVWGWGANLNEDESKQIQQQVQNFYVDGKSLDEASQSTKCDVRFNFS